MNEHRQSDSPRKSWNNKYQSRELSQVAQPATLLRTNKKLLLEQSGRRALDIACGLGVNSIFLSELGYHVDAVDISDIAIDHISDVAKARKLSVNPLRRDLRQVKLLENEYNIIINFNYIQRKLYGDMIKALKPGGLLFFETMNTDHTDILGHGIRREFTLEKEELRKAFASLQIIFHEEKIHQTDDGKKRSLTSLIANRKDH